VFSHFYGFEEHDEYSIRFNYRRRSPSWYHLKSGMRKVRWKHHYKIFLGPNDLETEGLNFVEDLVNFPFDF
jgi:hypothetical protein